MNQDILQGKWKEIKGEIHKAWGNVTGDDLEKTKGNIESIKGVLLQKYGTKKEEISQSLKEIFERFDTKSADVSQKIKEEVKK